jgi:hypothetical protein
LFKFKQIDKNPLKAGKRAYSCNLPEVTRLILVASGGVSGYGARMEKLIEL